MAVAYKQRAIRFPLDGADLLVVVGGEAPWPPRTRTRRRTRLRAYGLLDPHNDEPLAQHPFSAAAAAAIDERPDIPTVLSRPSHLPVLAALPDRSPWLPGHTIAGVSRATWRTALRDLAQAALVITPGGHAALNPELPALQTLASAYRRLYEIPPAPWQGAGWQVFHQHGVETFWRVASDGFPAGLTPVGPSAKLPFFQPVHMPWHLVYAGPRRLDRWDHLLATLASTHTSEQRAAGQVRADRRLTALATAVLAPDIITNRRFRVRSRYYRVDRILRDVEQALQGENEALWDEARRLIDEHGLERGALAR